MASSGKGSINNNSTLVEGKYTELQLRETAKSVVAKKTSNSIILDKNAEDAIPRFTIQELDLGRVLGRGGFCVVNEIVKIKIKDVTIKKNDGNSMRRSRFTGGGGGGDDDPSNSGNNESDQFEQAISGIVQDREFMSKYYLRGTTKDCRYAIKLLQDSNKKDASTYINGVVDLAVEARFLSVLRHANIIKMRAVASCSPFNVNDCFFVILDRLYDTLTVRLKKWKKQQPVGVRKLLDRSGKKERTQLFERICFAYDLGCALKFLHELHIMYRDIKPDNIGFDVRGDIKLFDFGLAREYDPSKRLPDGMFLNMTGDTGSPRYMDPQVAMSKPYNELCDVYSFCVLLWEMMELEPPFAGFTMNMFTKKVVEGGARPKVNTTWPKDIQDMLSNGFGPISKRKSMTDVCELLRHELSKESGYEIKEYQDISHRGDKQSRMMGDLRKSAISRRNLMAEEKNQKQQQSEA